MLARPTRIQTGREDPCVVNHEEIARIQYIWKLSEPAMLNFSTFAPNKHQPGIVALGYGMLCYQVLGQGKVKVAELHG